MRLENYDHRRGYENTNPGWHEHRVYYDWIDAKSFDTTIQNVVQWLYANIDKPERHCCWAINDDHIAVKFRHERDAIWFKLRF